MLGWDSTINMIRIKVESILTHTHLPRKKNIVSKSSSKQITKSISW